MTLALAFLDASAALGHADAASRGMHDKECCDNIGRCDDSLTEIYTEIATNDFTYFQLEENDADLAKLREWVARACGNGTLGPLGARAARGAVDTCSQAFEEFAARVRWLRS